MHGTTRGYANRLGALMRREEQQLTMMRLMWQSVGNVGSDGSVGGDDIAGAIVRVWAVNKNNCLLLHFVVIFGCVSACVCARVCICVCGCVCHKSVYTSIMRARGLKLTHAE